MKALPAIRSVMAAVADMNFMMADYYCLLWLSSDKSAKDTDVMKERIRR